MGEYTHNGYRVRRIQPRDNAAMAAIVRANLKAHGLDIPGTAYFDACLDDLWGFYQGRAGCGYYVVTDEAGTVVGGIGFDGTDILPDAAELQKMYLAESAKGKGLSYFLMGLIEDRMREAGFQTAYLETHTNLQRAIHVYGRCGYTCIQRPAAVQHGTMDHFYVKKL